jgi:hypothetical protein
MMYPHPNKAHLTSQAVENFPYCIAVVTLEHWPINPSVEFKPQATAETNMKHVNFSMAFISFRSIANQV